MLDALTGQIQFETPPLTIDRSLTRAAFQSSPAGPGAKMHIVNEPWCSYLLSDNYVCGIATFRIILWFHAERLTGVSLLSENPPNGKDWSEWSEAVELRRKALHDEWLAAALPDAKREFGWGTIVSAYDSRAGQSSIEIRYAA